MAALAAFSFSVEPRLLRSASPLAGIGRPRGFFGPLSVVICPRHETAPSLSTDFDFQDLLSMEHQEGLASVRALLHQERKNNGHEVITTVDHLKRLCIDHYFQDEIDNTMETCINLIQSDDLLEATLSFRLMREVGYHVSADDVLGRFLDNGNGDFNLCHSKDINGLLSLQDMSHLNMGEASLYKAKEFSRKHLGFAIKYLEPNLARYVRHSLDHPYHVTIMQYKARHHLSYLQSLPTRNTALEELALAEFRLNRLLHQSEMQEIKRWWINLGLAQAIPAARHQVMKWYMWSMTILQGHSFSRYRIEITKLISFIYVVDDIFDLVATQEELLLFTEAVKMWDLAAGDSLPSYMKSSYNALYSVTNDIADMVEKEHGSNPINHLKKAWAILFNGFMVEFKWLSTNQDPASEDYLRNGVITSGVPLVFLHLFFMLGHDVAEITDITSVISGPAKIMRLWDDMGSAKDEAQDGLDGSYKELYLKENHHCTPGEAEKHMFGMIASEWEELNRECFSRNGSTSPGFALASLNFARMISVMYGYDQEQGLPVLDDYIRMLLS